MTAITAITALVLHAGLVLAAAPMLLGLTEWLRARLLGRHGPSPLQPWHDWRRLFGKQIPVNEAASAVSRLAPGAALAATVTAALLVPSFTASTAAAPWSDLVVLLGLLGGARAMLALLALDAGSGTGGLAASRGLTLATLAEPALFTTIFLLAALAGTTNLSTIAASLRDGGFREPVAAAAVALGCVALADAGWDAAGPLADGPPTYGLGGAALLQVEAAAALRRVVWLSLLATILLPWGLASAGSGLGDWLLGAVAWVVKLGALAAGQTVVAATLARPSTAVLTGWLGIALVLGFLAVLMLFAGLNQA